MGKTRGNHLERSHDLFGDDKAIDRVLCVRRTQTTQTDALCARKIKKGISRSLHVISYPLRYYPIHEFYDMRHEISRIWLFALAQRKYAL